MNSVHQVILCVSLTAAVTVSNPITLSNRKYCGYQRTDDFLHPNKSISIDEFPWTAQLLYDEENEILCSGSLINNRYVLTTAHCLKPLRNTLSLVKLGDYNVNTDVDCVKYYHDETECSDPVLILEIKEIISHPLYRRSTAANDIGLIRLAEPVEFSDYVRPICLPQENKTELKDGHVLVTSGWGTTGKYLTGSELKKRIMTTLISNEKCQEYYKGERKPVTDDNLCAMESEAFTCSGDSGAPLMYAVRNQWEQVGIVARGKGCGNAYPTVYIKVLSYIEWIEKTLRP